MKSDLVSFKKQFKDKQGEKIRLRLLGQRDTWLIFKFFSSLSDRAKKDFHPHPFDLSFAKKITSDVNPYRHLRIVAVVGRNRKEKIIGYAFITITPIIKKWGYFGIAVLDRYSGRGIGTALTKTVLSLAKTIGVEKIYLNVLEKNKPAIHLYKKCSFKISNRHILKSLIFSLDEGIYGYGLIGLIKKKFFMKKNSDFRREMVWMLKDSHKTLASNYA